MSSMVNNNEFELFEEIQALSGDNCAFLVSFMDELHDHVEEGDEERLNSVIQSLEAEINDHHSSTNNINADDLDQLVGGLGQILDGHDCLVSFDDLDMDGSWTDHMEAVPDFSTTGDNLNYWYMYPHGDENMISTATNDLYYASQILWQDQTMIIQ